MKNTRKKMLLSSVAMLLVALVALGSATYAWFSVSKTVEAQNMTVKAIAAAGLEISKTSASTGFGTVANFEQDSTTNYDIKPVTWDTSANGFIPNGNVAPDGGAFTGSSWKDTGLTPPTETGKNAYFATYVVWVRSAASGDTHHVSAKVTATGAGKTFVRARLVDGDASTNNRNYADSGSSFAAKNTAAGGDATVTCSAYASSATGSTYGYPVSDTADDQTATQYTLQVWYDGMDEQCVDTAKNALTNLKIEFTATDM